MAIHIAETREPFAAAPTVSQVILAESAAYGRLCSELTRYVRGEISGRSFLISGHRGAGKTTLVLKAIEDTTFRMQSSGFRPLLIPLHGPDLLLPSDTDDAAQAPEAQDSDTAKDVGKNADKKDEAHSEAPPTPANVTQSKARKRTDAAAAASTTAKDTEQFLRQVTIGIYRALADLFHEAYLRAADLYAGSGFPAWRDLPELAAQLRIELDGAPDVSLLREFWRRADALQDGIIALARYDLIAPPPGLIAASPPPSPSSPAVTANRGMLELIALSSASQAYKVIRGKLSAKEGTKQDATQKRSLAFQTLGEVKNLLNPLLGALAGGAVGLGLKSAEISSMVAALAGTATGLGTAVTLNYSNSRSRENTRSTEVTFLPDTTISSLDRVLPLLVNRCRQAGVAPVFVVDELDKVSDLADRMGPLVRHLKSLVTEKSFFCFLADRSYLEGLRRDLVTTPYRTEYTYFSDRLFVLYRPSDLHLYLRKLLELGYPTDSNDTKDLELLPYILLHRSRMHPFDLRRQLWRMRNDQGIISLLPGAVRTELAYRFDILIQVAVEWLLEQQELRERLSQDEDFTQLVYDTLYYPSRMWEQGSAELNVSRTAFFQYLEERMSPTLGHNKEAGKKEKQAEEKCPLSDLDQEFLYARLRELLGFIADPGRLRATIEATDPKRFSTDVLEAIPIDPKFRLLDFRDTTRDICVWRRDLFGRSVERPGVEVVSADMQPRAKFIETMQATLRDIGQNLTMDRLATDFNVLKSTPAWTSVQPALRRVQRLWTDEQPEPYGEMESDSNAVWEYSQMLQASGVALAEALISSMILGQIAGGGGSGPNMEEQTVLLGLGILSYRLALRGTSTPDTARKLQRVMGELKKTLPWLQFNEASFNFNVVSVEQWAGALRNTLADPTMKALNRNLGEVAVPTVEAKWRERFREYFRNGTTEFEPIAGDLFCAAAWIGLSIVLNLDLSEVTIANWSDLILWSLADVIDFPSQPSPSTIFGFPALFQLGFGKLVTDAVNDGRMFRMPSVVPSKFENLTEERGEISEWVFSASVRASAAEMSGVLVVLDSPNPPPDWKVSAKYPAVVVRKKDLFSLRQALQGLWTQSMFSRVVVEVAPTLQTAAQVQQPPVDVGSVYPEVSNLSYSYFSRSAPPVFVASTLPFVSSPKTLDEAVELATPAPAPITPNAPTA